MQTILNTTYRHGTFIPEQQLDKEKEGKKFKILILEEEDTETRKECFFRFVEKQTLTLPKDYKFDRDEIYER